MKLKSFIRIPAGLKLLAAATLGLSAMNARAGGSAPDLDGDGVPNIVDPDIDNDGLPNALDENIDGGIARSGPYTGQYLGDHVNNDNPAERDIDDDGLADDSLGETDIDGDSKTDSSAWEDDIDGDSRGNRVTDDDDIDGDGRLNDDDDEEDDDGDGAHDRDDDDDNNDGIEDHNDDDHHDEDDEVEQRVNLTPGLQAPNGSSARVELQSMATGKMELKIRANDLPAGIYDIVIGGVVRGTLTMRQDDDETRGKTEFETGNHHDDELPLNFPVAAEPVSIVQGGISFFSGVIPTPPAPPVPDSDDDHHDHTYIKLLTRAPAAPAAAKAEAEIDVGIAGVVVFEVEVEDLPGGSYELKVDGVLRGSITMVQYPERLRGELRFETAPEGDDLLLDFPVVGRPVTVSQGATLFFSGTVPGGG